MKVEVLDGNLVMRAYYTAFLGTINDTELNDLLTNKGSVSKALEHSGLTYNALSTFLPNTETRLVFKIVEGVCKNQILVTDKILKINMFPTTCKCLLTDIRNNVISVSEK